MLNGKRVCKFHQELVFRFSEGQGLELLTPESPASQLLNREQLGWLQLFPMSFQLLFISILFLSPVAPVPSPSPQCTYTSLSMKKGNNSSIIAKVFVSLNSFAFFSISRVALNLHIGQLCP